MLTCCRVKVDLFVTKNSKLHISKLYILLPVESNRYRFLFIVYKTHKCPNPNPDRGYGPICQVEFRRPPVASHTAPYTGRPIGS